MQISTGVDIIKIARIKNSLENPRFQARVYGKEELALYYQKGENHSFLAGNFAAKEAFSKALGTGVRGFKFAEVQVLRDKLGKPFFKLSGNAKLIFERNFLTISLSISHEKEYAVAFVVMQSQFGGNKC